MADESSGIAALEEFKKEVGAAAIAKLDAAVDPIIGSYIKHGDGGKAILGYLAIKIAAMLESGVL